MGYTEKWYSCPNQSSRGGSGIAQVTFHTTEGAETGESLANWICQAQAQASYHAAVDNTAPGEVHRFVDSDQKAWSQAGGNPFALSVSFCTPSGAASNWSRDKWLSMGWMLDNGAAIAKTFCDWYGIPITPLNSSQAQSGAKGISQHVDGGSGWSGHHDCGPGFPEDEVIRRMKGQGSSGGGTTPPTPSVETDMTPAIAFWGSSQYRAMRGGDGRIYHAGPDTGWAWWMVDAGSNAKSGVRLAISAPGQMVISYINTAGHYCIYTREPGGGPWTWADCGGSA